MSICIICSGIPTSGKSTWAEKYKLKAAIYNKNYKIISCDKLREDYFGGKFKPENENFIWETFYELIKKNVENNADLIIDNTNLKKVYIDNITNLLTKEYNVVIVIFHIKLWKAKLRNYLRYVKTGKWIPLKVMNTMYANYKNMINTYDISNSVSVLNYSS